jgi:PAS domain S-box-containing protein
LPIVGTAARPNPFKSRNAFLRKDGSPLWVRVNADRVRDSAGRPVMGVGIISDISERKRIQFNAEFLLNLGRELAA